MAARTLEEMAAKGYAKATRKVDQMKRSWEAAKPRMKDHYDKLPFGPTRKANYKAAIDAATIRFDWDKWKDNWIAKMRE